MAIFQPKVKPQLQKPRPHLPRTGFIWVCPKIAIPENGWFIVENPIKMDDLGVPLFLEIPISQLCLQYLKVPKMERIAVISY